MASFITFLGRKLLESTIDIATKEGYSVIYGDTDSIMVNTNVKDIKEAYVKGLHLKKLINNQFRDKKIL